MTGGILCGVCRSGALLLTLVCWTSAAGAAEQPFAPPQEAVLAPWWTLHGSNLTGVYAYPSGGWNAGNVFTFGYGGPWGYSGYRLGYGGYGAGIGTPWWSGGFGSGGYYGVGSRPQPVWWNFPRTAGAAPVDALARAEQNVPQSMPHVPPPGHRHCPICDGGRGLEYWDLNVPGHPPRWLPPQTHPHFLPATPPQPGQGPPAGDPTAPPASQPRETTPAAPAEESTTSN